MTKHYFRNRKSFAAACLCVVLATAASHAQTKDESSQTPGEAPPELPQEVDVEPIAEDAEIATRLTRILKATEWFQQPIATVDEGVVFLSGRADSEPHREWAGRLAGKTQDVVAVVNRIDVIEKSMWDLTPAWSELQELAADTIRNSPLIGMGLLLLVGTWWATKWSVRGAAILFRRHFKSHLLRDVAARAVAVPVFLLGLYLMLRVSGLTRLAMTVVGGTGLLGLVIGFAFRDIAENFLASVLISMQHPFKRGDLIKVSNYEGYVQSVNTRATLLMTMDGNHVQIPNATIYKETIVNYTANSTGRFSFTVGIGYDDSISEAQSAAISALNDHPAVLDKPEPLVLVDALGAATVNLRICFWIDVNKHSGPKVRSAVIRKIKHTFEAADISMPDEAREVVFPAGVPVQMISEDLQQPQQRAKAEDSGDTDSEAHKAEGNLANEASEIDAQARSARLPESGSNLLE